MAPFAELIDWLEIEPQLPPEVRQPVKRRIKSHAEQFWAFVDKSAGALGCWLWRGSCTQNNGRPQFNDRSPVTGRPTMRGASIVSCELQTGA